MKKNNLLWQFGGYFFKFNTTRNHNKISTKSTDQSVTDRYDIDLNDKYVLCFRSTTNTTNHTSRGGSVMQPFQQLWHCHC